MVKINVTLTTVKDVQQFVSFMSNQPYDAYIKTDRYTVDAKSLMGIFSLDLSEPVELRIECDRDEAKDVIDQLTSQFGAK